MGKFSRRNGRWKQVYTRVAWLMAVVILGSSVIPVGTIVAGPGMFGIRGAGNGSNIELDDDPWIIDEDAEFEAANSGMDDENEASDSNWNNNRVASGSNLAGGMIKPMIGDLNYDLTFYPSGDTVYAGGTISYELMIKITGLKTEVEDVSIEVQLPGNTTLQSLDNLSAIQIFGANPEYDPGEHKLTYHYDRLQGGKTDKTVINVSTLNSSTLNGTIMLASAQLDIGDELYRAEASVEVLASGKIKGNIVCDFAKSDIIRREENLQNIGYYTLKVAVPAQSVSGDLELLAGSYITAGLKVPENCQILDTYQDYIDSGAVYETETRTVRWQIPVDDCVQGPSGELLYEELKFALIYPELYKNGDPEWPGQGVAQKVGINLTADMEATFIGNEKAQDYAEFVHMVTSYSILGYDGQWPYHYFRYNTTTDIYGRAWGHTEMDARVGEWVIAYLSPCSFIYNEADVMEKVEVEISFDGERLFFDDFHTGTYRLLMDYIPTSMDLTMGVKVERSSGEEWISKDVHVEADIYSGSRSFRRSDFGLTEEDLITGVRVTYENVPAFNLYYSPIVSFKVAGEVPDVVTPVQIETTRFDTSAVDPKGDYIKTTYSDNDGMVLYYNGGSYSYTLDRFNWLKYVPINILPEAAFSEPTGKVEVSLEGTVGSTAEAGEYTLVYDFLNMRSSDQNTWGNIKAPVTGAVLLPAGVTCLKDSEQLDGSIEIVDNWNNSQRQMVFLKFTKDYIVPGGKAAAKFKVSIPDGIEGTLRFDAYGLCGNEEIKVPVVTTSLVTDSIRTMDTLDLDGNCNTDEYVISSARDYIIGKSAGITIGKSVKGSLDENYSLIGLTEIGKISHYQISVTNKTGEEISNLTLMDVLPGAGDMGLTNNEERGSAVRAVLSGAITVPAGYEVWYSESANPKRDDLIRGIRYPAGVEQITNPPGAEDPGWLTADQVSSWADIGSFLIKNKAGTNLTVGSTLNIVFEVVTPDDLSWDGFSAKARNDELAAARKYRDEANRTGSTTAEPSGISYISWNTAAVQANELQAIESIRTGLIVVDNIVSAKLKAEKILSGRELKNQEFTFRSRLVSSTDNMVFEELTAKNDTAGNVTFPEYTFDRAGIYIFEITEDRGSDSEIVYDRNSYYAKISVINSGKNKLECSVSYGSDFDENEKTLTNESNLPPVFENSLKGYLNIRKTAASGGAVLGGAKFELSYRKVGSGGAWTTHEAELITGIDGMIRTGLPDQYWQYEYQLMETEAPRGYSKARVGIISFGMARDHGAVTALTNTGTDGYVELADDDMTIVVKNHKSGGSGGGTDPTTSPKPTDPTNPTDPTEETTTIPVTTEPGVIPLPPGVDPDDPGDLPPGRYLVTIIDENGVPTSYILDVPVPQGGLVKTGDNGIAPVLAGMFLVSGIGLGFMYIRRKGSGKRYNTGDY